MIDEELKESFETKIMTDEDLQELITKRDIIKEKLSKVINCYNEELRKFKDEETTLTSQINEENRKRLTAVGKDGWKEKVKNFFETYEYAPKKVTDELWMVEVNGKKLRSSKGKYTWTSENRAFRGICDYIYYNNYDIQHAIDSNELELGDIIESLIDDGYIKITRVV